MVPGRHRPGLEARGLSAILPVVSQARRLKWTEEDYFRLEAASPHKHEYLGGEIFAMAGAKSSHNLVATNLLAVLGALLRGKDCKPFNSDQRIHIPSTGLYTYADGGVTCGKWSIHPADGMSLLNPVLLFEVLSPATEEYDRGVKLTHYFQIPSLQEVVIVAQPERRIEHHVRTFGGDFASHERRDGLLDLALGISIPVDDIYDRIELTLG